LIDFINDPTICTLSFLVLTAGFLYISRLIVRQPAYFEAKPAGMVADFTVRNIAAADYRTHSAIIWMISCVRIRTYPSEDPDAG